MIRTLLVGVAEALNMTVAGIVVRPSAFMKSGELMGIREHGA